MLNILLIDDEYLVLKGVEAMLTHQSSFPVSVTPYIDSVEALAALPTLRPDVVVLDINMPELDGLSFIDQALSGGFDGSFIIISGYEDVNYLKRAFELHVADYLIKPINKQKLIDTLCRLNGQKAKAQQAMLTKLRLMLTLNDDPSRVHFAETDWERLFTAPCGALICLRRAPDADGLRAIEDGLAAYFQPVYYLHYKLGDAFLCGLPKALREEELAQVAQASGVTEDMLPGFSRTVRREDAIRAAVHGEGPRLLLEAVCDSVRRELGLAPAISDPALPFDVAVAVIRDAGHDEIVHAYQRLFIGCQDMSAAYARAFVEGVSALLIRHGYQTRPQQLARLFQMLWNDVSADPTPCVRMAELPQHYLRSLELAGSSPRYSEKVGEAVLFIHNHFAEDISLNDVADAVGLSPSYLSASFSREVGASFVAYLKKMRLEEACRQLETCPHLSVETIAGNVGYQTVGQFYKVFKSMYHISPKSWRERRKK